MPRSALPRMLTSAQPVVADTTSCLASTQLVTRKQELEPV